MPREHEDYRNNIERLNILYPEKEMLNETEAMKVMGFRSRETAKRHLPFCNHLISKATLARIMCGQAAKK